MPDDERTAALTSPTAVIAALLLFAAVLGFVVLSQVWPAEDPYAMDPVTAPPLETGVSRPGP